MFIQRNKFSNNSEIVVNNGGKLRFDAKKVFSKGKKNYIFTAINRGDITLDSCSTYIKMKDEIGAYAGTKSLMSTEGDIIRFDLDITDATGIEAPSQQDAAASEWYDLNGRRLGTEPTMKGVYVHGGKKVIIK